LPVSTGVLGETLNNSGSRRHFMRVTVDVAGQVRSAGPQGSHILNTLAKADGLLDLPAGAVLSAGTAVNVMQWD
jgi:molybdopterin biosynthesis enzyme